MKVELLAHTQLNKMFKLGDFKGLVEKVADFEIMDGQVISLAAIRQCYSHKTALEVLETESEKYFGDKGQEGKRLFNQIVRSGHLSTLEHISFTFAIEGVSRALLAQLTRHRVGFSFSVQSQRYNKFSTDSRSGGFDYVIPESIKNNEKLSEHEYEGYMTVIQSMYDVLISKGVPQEDARSILPNAATCNLVMTANLRALLDFYSKRSGNGAQAEIMKLAEEIKNRVIEVEPWTEDYFNQTVEGK